jgi:Protein of unknown function (DUF2497)
LQTSGEEAGALPEGGLLSREATAAVGSAFNRLTETAKKHEPTLEDVVRETLRPMLKSWLDENLPSVVERMVQEEIERVTRKRWLPFGVADPLFRACTHKSAKWWVSAALKHELGAEELIYGLAATLVAAPHSVCGKIHATCHWRVVGFNDLNVFERPKANVPSERFAAQLT